METITTAVESAPAEQAIDATETVATADTGTVENNLDSILDHILAKPDEPSSEAKAEGEPNKTEDTNSLPVDLEAVFNEPDTAEANRIEALRTALKDSPEALTLLEAETQQIEGERQGFQKLHEQVKALRDTIGVQSLTELEAPIQYGLDEARRWESLKNESTREAAVRSLVEDIAYMTGLDSDQIADLIDGTEIEAREKPLAALTDEMALKHLGLTPERYAALVGTEAKQAYIDTNAAKWQKVSTQVGFEVDPAKMFEASQQFKDAKVEQLLALSYPAEFAAHKAGLTQKSITKVEKQKSAPTLTKEVPAGKPAPITDTKGLLDFLTGS